MPRLGTTTVYIFSGSKVIAEYDNGASPSSPTREYLYAGGTLIATASGGNTYYHHQDHLSVRISTNSSGNIAGQQGHFPFGESWYASSTTTKYQFTTYERDAESNLDNFEARYYSSAIGRFVSADWSAEPTPVPYADLANPQTLNLYEYVKNNPLSLTDPDGHSDWDFLFGLATSIVNNATLGAVKRPEAYDADTKAGQVVGDIVSAVAGAVEAVSGGGVEVGGIGLDATGVGAVVGVPANVAGAGMMAHGGGVVISAAANLGDELGSAIKKRPGTLGKEDHQQTVKQEAAKMGENGQTEVSVQTPGGEKGSRRIDAAKVENGKITDAVQVIRPNKNGSPPAREVRAANDIQKATGVRPRMVPVRPTEKQ